jgi:uncharacterized protein YdaT
MIKKQELIEIREKTGKIEQKRAKDNKRKVNIDPGYLSKTALVLATKKAKPWKQPLNNTILAHKILEFKDSSIITFSHTFVDYKLEQNLDFLKKARNSLF